MAERKTEKLNITYKDAIVAGATNKKVAIKLPSGTGFTPQALAFVNENKQYIICSGTSKNKILLYDGKKINKLGSCKISLGHANGATYCHKNNLIYVTNYSQGSSNKRRISAIDPNTLKEKFSVYLTANAVGIAYDRITEQFYTSAGSVVYVYSYKSLSKSGRNIKYKSHFSKSFMGDSRASQDLGGHNGVVLVCRSYEGDKKQTSYIDCYDSTTGKYLKSYYSANCPELESAAIDTKGNIWCLYASRRYLFKCSNIFKLRGSGASDKSGIVDAAIATLSTATSNIVDTVLGHDSEVSAGVIASNAEKLYSSNNYQWTSQPQTDNDQKNIFRQTFSSAMDSWLTDGFKPIPESKVNTDALVSGYKDKSKHKKTKVEGIVSGPELPIALNPVEAPFIELTLGGHTFGTYSTLNYYDRYPNYIDSMSVVKTNGSMNEYTINLVHQIRPGSNPNYIDELISKNGYEKISIKYGDANSQIIFQDNNALLIGVDVNFDFVNCNIRYTLKATSSAIAIASHKRTFAGVTDKPSNIIRDLLYNDSSQDLLSAFPRMRDKNFVEKNNLLPSNDAVVSIEPYKNVNAFSYLKGLVSSMQSTIEDSLSSYMLLINDGYFSINEISKDYAYDAQLYEVNINYPDNNQVFSFSVDTNYSWPIYYEYSGKVSNYNYDITSNGGINTYATMSSNLLDYSSQMGRNISNNWWTYVTEFPISAQLNCRGLLSPLLLLTYIKINCLYYGAERINSGIYIVVGQTDTLSGSGYKTTLSLLKVAGPQQHLTVDGRVKT